MSPPHNIAETNGRFGAHLAQALAAAGVEHVVVSPGSRSTPMVLGFETCPGVRMHPVLDERAAGFVGLGIGRSTGRPAVVLCSSGSAGGHLLPAAIEAFHSSVPLILLTADRPPELHDVGAPQTISQRRFFADVVRWSADLGVPHEQYSDRWLRSVATLAVDRAASGPAGPVHLNLPFREPLWEPGLELPKCAQPPVAVFRSPSSPADDDVARLVERCQNHRRGVIVCGALSPRLGMKLAGPLLELSRRLGWPIVAEPTSQLRFGEPTTSGVIAYADALLRDETFAKQSAPELVLRFGQAPLSKPVARWLRSYATEKTVLVEANGAWNDPDQTADTLVCCDEPALCTAMVARLSDTPTDSAWLRWWQAADGAARRVMVAACNDGFWEGAVASAVVRTLPPGTDLHIANSMPMRDLDGFGGNSDQATGIFANRGANGIDGTLATAAGEVIGTGRPMVVLCGDLAFRHDLGGLAAACELGVSLTLVVNDNGGGHIFDHLPIADHATAFERYFVTPQSSRIDALAAACGAQAVRAEELSSLSAALSADISTPGVGVIEAPIDPTDNLARHHDAWAAVSRALRHMQEEAA